jgi:hypothetical protein
LGELPFALAMVVRRSSMLSPYLASARGLNWMRTAGRCPPEMLTTPTPGSWEIFCASRVKERSSTSMSLSVSEVTASVMMGASAGLNFA